MYGGSMTYETNLKPLYLAVDAAIFVRLFPSSHII